MDKKQLIGLAREVVDLHPGNLQDPEDLLTNHLPTTYDIAHETSELIAGNYQRIGDTLDAKMIAIAGGLHDIGRPLNADQEFHEIRGYWFIRDRGLEYGVAESQEIVDKIARIMLPHGSVYETFVSDEYSGKRIAFLKENENYIERFGAIAPEDLLPSTLSQAIVDYAELSNLKGKRVDYRERLKEAIHRYKEKRDPRADCIIAGSQRRINLADKVASLRASNFSEEEAIALISNLRLIP